ncbi:MAG: hypothetical protein QM398_13080 [Thermoproteota archaeon]|jgi:hypothetical protein|nr:hypothetical protein [Thermoproteota archaeon]
MSLFADKDVDAKALVNELRNATVDRLTDAENDLENIIICEEQHRDPDSVLNCVLQRLRNDDSSSVMRSR